MRTLPLLALLFAVAASAQTDSTDARAQVDAQIAEARAQMPGPAAPPVFIVEWADPRFGYGGGSGKVEDGIYTARATPLSRLLVQAWTAHVPFREDPVSLSTRYRHVDAPDSLRRRPVNVRMVQPGLTRETFGPALIARMEDALGLDIRTENRPHVVYALRTRPGSPPRFAPLERETTLTMLSTKQTFFVRNATGFELAKGLGAALGQVVVDETGITEPFDLELAFTPDEIDFDAHTLSAEAIDAVRARLLETAGLELVPEVWPVEWMVVRAR